ncbi:MAG: hypothetical protein KIS92_02975 [Planctomycetota bacterium]|nr:hypothetical protein [Planctomycetota bacterium]
MRARAFLRFAFSFLLLAARAPWAEEPGPPLPRAGELFRAFVAPEHDPWTFDPRDAEAARRVHTTPAAAWDLTGTESVSVKAQALGKTFRAVRLRWYVRSHACGLYAANEAVALSAAGATDVRLKLAPEAGALAPVGHQRPWDALAAAEILSLELHAEANGSGTQPVKIELSEPALSPRAAPPAPRAARLCDVALEACPPDLQAAVTLTFRIDPLPADPFASEGPADVRVSVLGAGPGGEALAFLDQDFYAEAEGSASRKTAAALPRYRAYLPALPPGTQVKVTSGERAWTMSADALLAQGAAPRPPGYDDLLPPRWRVPLEVPLGQARDPLDEGRWASAPGAWRFTPEAREPWTVARPPAAGNVWRPVPFWNARWGAFGGARRPDLALASRLDELLARAARSGRSEPLVVIDGEPFARQGLFNWASHPLNLTQGGTLSGPGELMNAPQGIDFCRRTARYALARWGRSKAVSSFLIDTDLNAPAAADLHARLAASLRGWPGLGEGGKPFYSLHPLACPPMPVADAGGFALGARNPTGAWYAGDPLPARVSYVAHDNTPALEIHAQGQNASVCAIKPYAVAAADYRAAAPDNFHRADALLFDVWLPPDAPADLRAGVHLRDRDRLWYQALLPGLLRPGDWTTCLVDLRESNAQGLQGVGHKKPWTGYSRGRLTEIGLHVYTTHPEQPIVARFARLRGVRFDRLDVPPARALALLNAGPKELRKGERWECRLAINHVYENPFDAQQADLAAVVTTPSGRTVRVPAFFDQPCRRREAKPGGDETVEPEGPECWTVRFRATEEGPHAVAFELREGGKYHVTARAWAPDRRFDEEGRPFAPAINDPEDWVYGYEELAAEGRRRVETVAFEPGKLAARLDLGQAFTAGPAAEGWHGFVRADEGGRYLRFDDGTFFYPIGPCVRSPSDNRVPYDDPKWNEDEIDRIGRRGTYQFDEYFAAFEKAGINWARVWMCSWWGGLQWRRDWPGYGGPMRYNLTNAWRMDHVLDEAERRGVRINLCLVNHGQYSHVIDTEWRHNPLNAALGGPLQSPAEFFTRAEAKSAHMNMLRYAVARYGHSPAVLTWALFSELEFTDEYRPSLQRTDRGVPDRPAPQIERWHAEMSEYLKSIDPWKHLVSSHFSHPVRGTGLFHLPQIEIAMSNAYSAFDELAWGKNDAAAALSDFWDGSAFGGGVFRGMKAYKKPVLVEEQGRHWMGVEIKDGRKLAHNTRETLDADLHAGLWGSFVQPLAGATGYWWWLHVHFDDRYGEYKALADFARGEDLRPEAGEAVLEPELLALEPLGRQLTARALRSNRRAYVWVYHRFVPLSGGPFPQVAGQRLEVPGLEPGAYAVEFWDTRRGEKTGSATGQVQRGERPGTSEPLIVLLPPVKGDLAIKIKPAAPAESTQPRR